MEMGAGELASVPLKSKKVKRAKFVFTNTVSWIYGIILLFSLGGLYPRTGNGMKRHGEVHT